jgi:hopanoid biosynthesis associated radical SAM protein HpnH
MLEPLFRCNLACAGCGKIQYPDHVLDKHLTPEQCWAAAEECGAPIVSIPGGEPLIHPQMAKIVEGLVAQERYVYLCTNAILMERKLDEYKPSKFLTFSVHMDGLKDEHDLAVCRDGVYDVAVRAIKEALKRGHRVTTNTTLFDDANPERVRKFFDEMMALGVEGMMISPGYSYQKAPDQQHFLKRERTRALFPHSRQPEAGLAVQSIASVPGLSDGQAGVPMHPVGQSDVQRVWLAEALLLVARGVYKNIPRADGGHSMGPVRHRAQ